MKTFFLYFGNVLVTSVRMSVDATPEQIIKHALENHQITPCINSLYPSLNPGEIANLIHMTTRISDIFQQIIHLRFHDEQIDLFRVTFAS